MSLGSRIRQLRQSRGLTQQQLGGGKLSKSFISLVERERTRPSVDTLVLFARRLGTSVDALLGQDGHIPDLAAENLLMLSRQAVAQRDFGTATKLLEAISFVAGKYGLGEAPREIQLQGAEIAIEQRDFAQASAVLASVLSACEREKDYWRLGRTLLLQGRQMLRQRELVKAVSLYEKALAALRTARAGRDPVRIQALIELGTTLGLLDKPEPAFRRYLEAAQSQAAKNDPILTGRALWGLGWMHRKLGRLEQAREFLMRAKDTFESAEELTDLMGVLHNLGQVEYEQGQPKEALRHFHHALRVMERAQRPLDRAAILTEIGRVHLSLGELAEAEHFVGETLAETRRTGDVAEAAEAQIVLSYVRLARGEVTAAVNGVRHAMTTFQERGMEGKALRLAREFGLALRQRGAHAESAEFLALVAESTLGAAPRTAPPLQVRT
jgi:tetratricopeptide (TPR) repeat protein